ncbi:MAG: Fibronectin type 3 protein, partial [Phycisphaerales bacterium]|nr:Fibronectin type 3 protein [Phycisphaerales bacterium]
MTRRDSAQFVARNVARLFKGSAPAAAPVADRARRATARACHTVIEQLELRQLMAADLGTAGASTAVAGQFATLAATAAHPSVVSLTPGNAATNVRRDAFVAANGLSLPNGGIDKTSVLVAGNITLVRASDNKAVPGTPGVSGGGDSVIFTPSVYLDANTQYKFSITAGVKDVSGATFTPFTSTFTTGTLGGPVATSIGFTKAKQAATTGLGKQFTAVTVGPDGKLYAATFDGVIYRWTVGSDGTLSGTQTINTVNSKSTTGLRTITGIVFDPTSTSGNLIAWVTHNAKADANGPNFTGKVSRLSGPDLGTYQDYVTGLPRSVRDHLTNQAAFGPDGALYFNQAAQNSMGAADPIWGLDHPEVLLSAATLRLDVKAVATRLANGQGAVNAKTPDGGGTYDPYASGAPLTIYADGVRNGYDLVWHSNGKLYTAVNGSASGGNAPKSSNTGRRLDTHAAYAGPAVPALTNVAQKEHDWLFQVQKGAYYGHPNPARGEFVFNGGNPTTASDAQQVDAYPVGVKPDANWHKAAYDFGESYSPDGMIEYKSSTFGGALKNKLLVVRYAGGDDIIALTPNADGSIDASKTITSVGGIAPFVDPVDLIEFINPADPYDQRNGTLYVAEYGGKAITALKPNTPVAVPPTVPPTTGSGAGGPAAAVAVTGSKIQLNKGALVFNAVKSTTSGVAKLVIKNAGTTALSITGLTLGGTSAASFTITNKGGLPASLAAGASATVQVTFKAGTTVGAITTATLTVASNDASKPSIVVALRGLVTAGTGGQFEPSLQKLFDLYQLNVATGDKNAADTDLYNPTEPLTGGEEVTAPRLVKAGTGSVLVQVLGTFAGGSPAAQFGWYTAGSANTRAQLLSVPAADAQTVNPTPTGSTTFDPGSATFGLYSTFPIFGNTAYSEDNLNTAEQSVADRRKVRFYPLKNPDGSVVANAYVFTSEDFVNGNGAYDVNDFFGIIRNVKAAVAATGGVTLTNLDGAPADNRLVFNRIGVQPPEPLVNSTTGVTYTPLPNAVHDTASLKVTNNGTSAVTISSLALSNASAWKIKSGPAAGAVLQPGASATVVVQFVATSPPATTENETIDPTGARKALNGTYLGTLTVNTTGGAKVVTLAGYFQKKNEDNQEANLPTLVNKVFGYGTQILKSGETLDTGGAPTAVGEEVKSGLWKAADSTQPVSVRQLVAYHTQGDPAVLSWYPTGGAEKAVVNHALNAGQSLLPLNTSGGVAAGAFAPGTASFGLRVQNEYSEDARNVKAGVAGQHRMRFWPARDGTGALIPNTYLMGMDYSGINYDYQDNVYLITNVKAANGAGPTPTVPPVVPPTTPSGPTLAGLDLLNAATDATIGALSDGATIDLTGGKTYSVRANVGTGTIGSVAFAVDGVVTRTENFAPYTIAGEASGSLTDVLAWAVPAGQHVLTVTPFGGSNGTGTVGEPLTVTFTGNTTTVPPTVPPTTPTFGVTGLTLIDADTDLDLGPVTDGMTLDRTGGKQFAIRAETTGATTKSVVFVVDGTPFRTESSAPYTIAGDAAGGPAGDYAPWTAAAGPHTLTVQGYDATGGAGTLGLAVTFNLNVVDGPVSPPPPPPPPVAAPTLSGLTLVNANTDAAVGPLAATGTVLDLSGSQTYTVQAVPATTGDVLPVGSVVFKVDGATVRTDDAAPFVLGGEDGINLLPWVTTDGSHLIEVTPFTAAGGLGTA